MAKIEFKGINEYAERLATLGMAAEGICKFAIYDAAGIVVEAVKQNTPEDTGDLKKSIGLAPMKNKDGFIYTQVEFNGYDRNGTPNSLKARVLESGRSGQYKHPFIRPAVNRVKKQAELSIETALDMKLNEIMNKPGD